MPGLITLYEILEVSPRACPQVIRAAYRSLTQNNHPDKNPGSDDTSDKQAQINRAYAVLSDACQRQRYDRTLELKEPFIERRNAIGVLQPNCCGAITKVQAMRPFAFRPLL